MDGGLAWVWGILNVLGAILCAEYGLKTDGMAENLFGLVRKCRSENMWLRVGVVVGSCDVEAVRGRDSQWGWITHLGKIFFIYIEHIFDNTCMC